MKIRFLKTLAILWITFISISFAQRLWISDIRTINESVLIENKQINKKDNCIEIDVSYPKISNEKFNNINNEIFNWTDNWIKEVEGVLEDYKKSGYICNIKYQLYSRYYLTKEGNNILSFYIDYYQFTGGAHGITMRKAYSVDKNSGKNLKLNELFKKGYNYKQIIDEEIRKEINKNKENYFDNGSSFKGIEDNTKFYINDDNLVIYYEQYEIAPYAAGLPEFNISLNKFNGNLVYDKI
ncbi:DUF3298 and DUF4163 domain-containing protein [Eubacterium multiforme]|uniref:Deacetylase PdaC domain-containing protein n=1 Tax=Eubacterium multiforme TaxID=83339 RepID=A0ABT9UUJ4_9FIRM|nr:DUF3298 and DUF4163 domain-containing protein [Eubacterium multiforme]MDQ0149951.1 hypothetical protein [Eubacterium multiforme]